MRMLTKTFAAAACALPLVIGASANPATRGEQDRVVAEGPAGIRDAGAGLQTATSSPTGSGAQGVLALAGGIVWALDGAGHIVRSTDAGGHWRAVFPGWAPAPTALQLTGAFFLNADDAWAVTAHEWPAPPGVTTVWRTTDSGASWHQGRSLPGMLTDYGSLVDQLVFADAKHGYAFSVTGNTRRDLLWGTSDGGTRWRRLAGGGLPWQGSTVPIGRGPGCTATGPFILSAASASVLLLTDNSCPTKAPGAWRSDDGGRHWAPVELQAPSGGWPSSESWGYPSSYLLPASGAEVLSTRFFGGGSGVLSVTARPGELLAYRSQDSGASWRLASVLRTGSLSRPTGFAADSPSSWELPAPAGLYSTQDAGRHWDLQPSTLSLPATDEVSFASPETGMWVSTSTIGTSGLRTTDGGKSWQRVSLPGATTPEIPFSALDFATPSRGWLAGADGVLATTDGGHTWDSQLATSSPVEELSLADAEHGWALTSDQLFATTDGGKHWSARPETALGAISSVALVRPGFGVALVCEPGGTRVLATHNGGSAWSALPVPNSNDLQCGGFEASPGQLGGLCFGTPQVGWAVVRSPGGTAGILERTTDGGRRWQRVASFSTPPNPLACEGSSQLWVGLDWMDNMSGSGDLATTMDGGRNWRIGKLTGPAASFAPRMNPADGTAVLGLGTAGGPAASAFWAPVQALVSPGPGDLVDLWQNGGAGCDPGFGLLVTMDAGATWSTSAADTTRGEGCGGTGLPYLADGGAQEVGPSVSFPDADNGFVLGQAAGPHAAPKGSVAPITMALISTKDGGDSWHLLARFSWHST